MQKSHPISDLDHLINKLEAVSGQSWSLNQSHSLLLSCDQEPCSGLFVNRLAALTCRI